MDSLMDRLAAAFFVFLRDGPDFIVDTVGWLFVPATVRPTLTVAVFALAAVGYFFGRATRGERKNLLRAAALSGLMIVLCVIAGVASVALAFWEGENGGAYYAIMATTIVSIGSIFFGRWLVSISRRPSLSTLE